MSFRLYGGFVEILGKKLMIEKGRGGKQVLCLIVNIFKGFCGKY